MKSPTLLNLLVAFVFLPKFSMDLSKRKTISKLSIVPQAMKPKRLTSSDLPIHKTLLDTSYQPPWVQVEMDC